MAAPTTLTVSVDDEEYSRHESGRELITYTVTVTGSSLTNEEVTIELMKARRNRDVAVAFSTLTLTSAGADTYSGTFDLTQIVDISGVPKVRRGEYFVRATSVTDDGVYGETEDFLISLVSVDRLRADYFYGVDLKATEMLSVLEQPSVVTGVIVTEVSHGHSKGWIPLSYNIVDNGSTVVRTLSWCGGPQVTITAGTRNYILRRGTTQDWIRVKVGSIASLPATTVSEDLLVGAKTLDDTRLRGIIDSAVSWLEDVALFVYLEPTIVVTKPDLSAVTIPSGTDIPQFIQVDWDEIVDAVSYRTPSAGHWINFKMPYKPLIRFNELYGEVATNRVLDVALEWVEAHERGGFVELVPFNQTNVFNFIGLAFAESTHGYMALPNFWNFEAVVGFRDTPAVLLELVAKKAAIDILTIAGMARRPGVGSMSVSRDGISESVSYIASAQAGIYNASIKQYQDFIDENLKLFKGAYSGSRMVVL